MNKEVLNKNVQVEDDLVIITENIKTTMTIDQLESKLREISSRKIRLKEENNRIVAEYNQLLEEEKEINNLINQLVDKSEIQTI